MILNYFEYDMEMDIILVKCFFYGNDEGCEVIFVMVCVVDFFRNVFMNGDFLIVMSLWMVLMWV